MFSILVALFQELSCSRKRGRFDNRPTMKLSPLMISNCRLSERSGLYERNTPFCLIFKWKKGEILGNSFVYCG